MSKEKNDKKISKIILVSFPAVLILVAIILILKFTSKPESIPNHIAEMLDKPISLDDNIKNALLSSQIALSDKYIFYSDNNGLYRINKDGSDKLELDTGSISNINIYKDHLYYSKGEPQNTSSGNSTYYIFSQTQDGSDKSKIHEDICQRINSMLVVNDIIVYNSAVLQPDGGKNEQGTPTGKVVDKYMALTVDGKHAANIQQEQFSKLLTINFPYNRSDLDTYLREEYSDVYIKSSRYYVGDTMYFDARSNKDPKFTAIFSISKKDDKLNLIKKYDLIEEDNYSSEKSLLGFCYADNNIYFILSDRRKYKDTNEVKDKLDLCKLDLSDNTVTTVDNIFTPEGY